LVRWASQRPYRTLRQTLQICRRRMPHAVCVPWTRWGPRVQGVEGVEGVEGVGCFLSFGG
jgi:hypothetical protein